VQVSVIICFFTKIVGCVCQVSHGRPFVGLRLQAKWYSDVKTFTFVLSWVLAKWNLQF